MTELRSQSHRLGAPMRLLTLLLVFITSTGMAWSQGASFQLLSPRPVIEGRNFNLTFRLTNGDANPPAAPELSHCTLLYGPSTSTMQSTEIINGKVSSTYSIDYTFVYRADSPGEVRVPEVRINSGGKQLSSKSTTFEILPADRQSSQGQNNRGGSQQSGAAPVPSNRGGNISADDLLVRVSFSRSHVYEQEPVLATIKVYTKYDISSFMVTTQPAFEGFLTEELPVALEMNLEHYNGQNYHTAVLKRLLLYPQKAGTLSVNSGKYDVTLVQYETVNMGFFRTQRPVERTITTTSNAATLTVEALPEPRPAGFNGAVGTFKVNATLDPQNLRTNEAATYTYTVSGTGNIKFLNPQHVDFPAGIDVYTPKTDIDTRVSGSNMTGTFSTVYTLVPQEQGAFTIDGSDFVYFDPQKKSYETLSVPALEMKVARGATTSASPTEQKALDVRIDDILHIHPLAGGPRSISSPVIYSWGYWLVYILCLAALVSAVLVYRRQLRLRADVAGRKHARAGRVASKRLKEARTFMKKHQSAEFYESLSRALKGYLGDKLGIAPSQLVSETISEKLLAAGVDEENIQRVLEVLNSCEMARFTPMNTDDEMSRLYDEAVSVINSIER